MFKKHKKRIYMFKKIVLFFFFMTGFVVLREVFNHSICSLYNPTGT